ncbi:MFS general substrate transporter [Aspergillus sclerotiicarbonarius CBS 121057]|uniref:MFS general substrate transporter n=1 Tax=Aspergillus sclerotiicarbonarius (strain CBS 121057 / IBT 28362) TaxID=1448318 RepID=A0A319E044_ASPSB|nr:MFS general substrate transporter [Aspergillus sclerotiicarbonarius CBS 121057]
MRDMDARDPACRPAESGATHSQLFATGDGLVPISAPECILTGLVARFEHYFCSGPAAPVHKGDKRGAALTGGTPSSFMSRPMAAGMAANSRHAPHCRVPSQSLVHVVVMSKIHSASEAGSTRSRSTSLSSSDDDSLARRPYRLGTLRTRTRSQSRHSTTQVDRVHSGRHLDDHSVYHSDHEVDLDSSSEDQEEKDEPVFEVRGGVVNERDRDLEAAASGLEKSRTARSDKSRTDPKLVKWNGPDDPENPKNWPMKRKWAAVLTVSCFTFISPVSSSMVAPALGSISADFHITDEVISQLTLSVFILAYAVGPLFLGPLSEIYGRVIVLQLANLLYLVFNIGCGVSQTKVQMIVCRFFAGLGGSAPLAIGGGVLSDCFKPEQRGKSVAIYSLAPLLGPAVGPIAGGFIAENTTWRWVFYATSIADGLIQVAGLFFLRETYAPVILKKRAQKLRKETNDPDYQTEYERQNKTLGQVMRAALIRPFRLLATQPIVQALAAYMAFIYGTMYLVLSTFPSLWTSPDYYNESTGIGGLNYISLGLGFWLGSQICAPLNDRIYRRLKARNNGVGQPEFRVPLLYIGALFIPAGLFIYGWTAQTRCHWIAPNIGACIYGMGNIITFQCLQTYIVDSYTRFAASALAAVACMRSLAGFGFPLFAPSMYQALHYGWGNSVLAFIAIGLGVPAPIFLWRYGEKLRKMSTYAAG